MLTRRSPAAASAGATLASAVPLVVMREVVEPERREPLDEGGEPLAHERLAAREADGAHAQPVGPPGRPG